jgi:hypothetical protein
MKKILYSLIIFCLVLAACKKDHKIAPGGAQKVTFNVGFSQTMGDFNASAVGNKLRINSADTSVTNHVKIIYYMVFKADGTLLHNIRQAIGDVGFGSYTDNLNAGTYTVAIAAGGTDLIISKEGNLDVQKISSNSAFYDGNMFFKKIQITVTSSSITESVSLHHAMSKLVFKTNDIIPTGATYAKFTISTAAGFTREFQLSTESGAVPQYANSTDIIQIGGSVVDPGNPPLPNGVKLEITSYFIYYAPLNVDVIVSRVNAQGAYEPVYGQKSITNIAGAPNAVTTLTGNLFGGNGIGTTGFKIAVDSTWNAPINQGF